MPSGATRLHLRGPKNSLITNNLVGGRERLGRARPPNLQVEQITQSSARPDRYAGRRRHVMDNEGPSPRGGRPASRSRSSEVLVLAAGATSTAPLSTRSRLALPALSQQVGRSLGANGDDVAAVEFNSAKVRSCSACRGYD